MWLTSLFGGNLRRVRVARGWTQEAVAERMSTSVRQLRDYELGKRPPSVAMLEQWLEALEAPPIELTRPIVPAKTKSL